MTGLSGSDRLTADYDVALLDLDGVIYVGSEPIPGAAAALTLAREAGMRLAYVTNNASRRPAEVAALLAGMGVPATPQEVVTSAQAAVHLLRDRLEPGATVLVVGSEALAEEVRDVGLEPVRSAEPLPAAVVQGYGPETGWRDLAEAALAIRGGALWIATNGDTTLPTARGPVPGNGALVAALRVATGAEPVVVGKPHPRLHRESVERTGAKRPLVVGDRLDTDIEGAVAAGTDSLLVLTGLTTPAMLLLAPPGQRPTYIARDLCGLIERHPAVGLDGVTAVCREHRATIHGTEVVLSGAGEDGVDALRAMCAACWRLPEPPTAIRAEDAASSRLLRDLGIEEPRSASGA